MSAREFPPFAVTVDLVVLTVRPPVASVLLVKRTEGPFPETWALPGGFVGPKQSLLDAARHKLESKTGIDMARVHLEQLSTFGEPERDPRMRTVSVAYMAMVTDLLKPTTSQHEPVWTDITNVETSTLAFDHNDIFSAGLERARAKLEYTTLATKFCPPEFTISGLRSVYETLWGHPLDPANFHRKALASSGFVEATGKTAPQGKGRPAKKYRAGTAAYLSPPIQRPDSPGTD